MYPRIYLNRHWKNRLCLVEAEKLSTPRLLTYYRKHIGKRDWFKDSYPEKYHMTNDDSYNSEFGTSPNAQFNEYLDSIKAILDKREDISKQ